MIGTKYFKATPFNSYTFLFDDTHPHLKKTLLGKEKMIS